jgi:spore coat protein U-like protein
MKKLFFISLFLITTVCTAQAQDQIKKSTKPSSYKGKDDNCMLNASFDTPLEIQSEIKAKSKVSHMSADYIQFNSNGTYTESINGAVSNGTWTYNYDTHEVTISCNGFRTYKITLDGNNKTNLEGKNGDQIKLKKKS